MLLKEIERVKSLLLKKPGNATVSPAGGSGGLFRRQEQGPQGGRGDASRLREQSFEELTDELFRLKVWACI